MRGLTLAKALRTGALGEALSAMGIDEETAEQVTDPKCPAL